MSGRRGEKGRARGSPARRTRKGKDVRLESMASSSPSPHAAPPRRRLHCGSSWSPHLWFSRHVVPHAASLQDPIRRVGGVALFRAVEGAEWPNLARFFSGPYLTERSILARPDFEPGHVNPGGSGRVPGHSGPKRTRPH